jgi:hypothetical protein
LQFSFLLRIQSRSHMNADAQNGRKQGRSEGKTGSVASGLR